MLNFFSGGVRELDSVRQLMTYSSEVIAICFVFILQSLILTIPLIMRDLVFASTTLISVHSVLEG